MRALIANSGTTVAGGRPRPCRSAPPRAVRARAAAAESSQAGYSRFQVVPYGESASQDAGGAARTICCDGLVPGSDLQLTHWTGNATPAAYYADTSTEIALNFAASPEAADWSGARVLNNHFDTDGVLSAWALLEPEAAAARREVLIQAAEAGDFGEWPSDDAVRVDAALCELRERSGSTEEAYAAAFARLPALLDDVDSAQELWQGAEEEICRAERALSEGTMTAYTLGSIGVVTHAPGVAQIPAPLLAKTFQGGEAPARFLLAFETAAESGGEQYMYVYQRPGHAWATTVSRPR
mmetsp:Transcript_8094/g.20782  ORF Transcript_8094/g.20782 Transcript_8094/m.20782 type:complete len:296 (-) Transcript_8094:394-1281(-)